MTTPGKVRISRLSWSPSGSASWGSSLSRLLRYRSPPWPTELGAVSAFREGT